MNQRPTHYLIATSFATLAALSSNTWSDGTNTSIAMHYREATHCMHHLSEEKIGLYLEVPKKIFFGNQVGAPTLAEAAICVTFAVEAKKTFGLKGKAIFIQSINNSEISYQAELDADYADDFPIEPEPDVPELDPNELDGIISSGQTRRRLGDMIALPSAPDKYIIWVEWGPYVSDKHEFIVE